MALTTLSQIKAFLNETGSANDVWYTALLAAAEATVEEYCGRKFASDTYTEYLSGNGTSWITLKHRPVTAIASVYLDNSGYYGHYPTTPFAAATLLTNGVNYVLDWDTPAATPSSRSGILIRIGGTWPEIIRQQTPGRLTADNRPSFGNLKVTYTAGFTTIPMDIQYAVCWSVAFMKRTIPVGGNIVQERIGDYSYALAEAFRHDEQYPEIGTIRSILSRYKEIAW